jgi:hypothetical protein
MTMDSLEPADLAEKYNEGVVSLPLLLSVDAPPLTVPNYHPSPKQLAQARKYLLLSIIGLLLVGLLTLFLLGLGLTALIGL